MAHASGFQCKSEGAEESLSLGSDARFRTNPYCRGRFCLAERSRSPYGAFPTYNTSIADNSRIAI